MNTIKSNNINTSEHITLNLHNTGLKQKHMGCNNHNFCVHFEMIWPPIYPGIP